MPPALAGVPLLSQTRLDVVVVGFAFAIAVLASVIFGTMPAWQASSAADVVMRIREEGGSTTSDPRRQRMRSLLIVTETTLAVVLLVGAGLLARSFERLLAVDLGFNPRGVQTFAVSLPDSRYAIPAAAPGVHRDAARARRDDAERRIRGRGVRPSADQFSVSASRPRREMASRCQTSSRMSSRCRCAWSRPDYFKTMGIAIGKGRGFSAGDRMGAQLVVLLNQAGASRVWPDQDAMGHQLELGTRMGLGGARAGGTVVGIVADVRDYGPAAPVPPTLYLPHAQWPDGAMTIVARARNGDPSSLVQPLRSLLQDLDAEIPMSAVRSMDQIGAAAVAQPRLYLVLIASFAGTAMLLSAIGLYGVLAYAVGQRTREIGIRLALGARRGEVLRMVMTQAGRLAVVGVVLGLVAAVVASRALRSQLFEIAPTDRLTYAVVGAGLLIVALLASWIPAWRASRIDPLRALRHD